MFPNKKTTSKQLENKVQSLKDKNKSLEITKKLQDGKFKKRIVRLEDKAAKHADELERAEERRLSDLRIKNEKIEILKKDIAFLEDLKDEKDHIRKTKRTLAIENEELIDEKEIFESKKRRLDNLREDLEAKENASYTKGYSDGLADGLRKAHDITREDRKMMTMIAMSTNQGKAIEASMNSMKQLEERTAGQDDKQS